MRSIHANTHHRLAPGHINLLKQNSLTDYTIVPDRTLCYIRPPTPEGDQHINGDVAEWLRSGLQIRVRRFDSGRRLHGLKSA